MQSQNSFSIVLSTYISFHFDSFNLFCDLYFAYAYSTKFSVCFSFSLLCVNWPVFNFVLFFIYISSFLFVFVHMFWRSKTCFRAAEKTMCIFLFFVAKIYVKHLLGIYVGIKSQRERELHNFYFGSSRGTQFQLSGAAFHPPGVRTLFAFNYLPKAHATTPIELEAKVDADADTEAETRNQSLKATCPGIQPQNYLLVGGCPHLSLSLCGSLDKCCMPQPELAFPSPSQSQSQFSNWETETNRQVSPRATHHYRCRPGQMQIALILICISTARNCAHHLPPRNHPQTAPLLRT